MSPHETPAPDVVLSSLAIIRANFDYNQRSYLDNFVPFALDAVAAGSQADYSDTEVADLILRRFGLHIPPRVVSSILSRAAREKRGVWRDRRFSLTDEGRAGLPDIGRQQATLMREQAQLARGLVDFAAGISVTMTDEDAEQALLGYVETRAVPLLTHAVRGGTYADDDAKAGDGTTQRYVVAAYVAHVAEGDQTAFEQLESMVKGSMLASALYLPATSELNRRFNHTTLFLDTPILIRLLGYDGDESLQATQDVIRLAQTQGAEIACFEHTSTELRGVIEGSIPVLRRNGAVENVRRIDRYFLDCDFTESDVRLLMERMPEDLDLLRVQIVSKPKHVERLGVDEVAMEKLLQSKVGYRRRSTLLNDLDSITAVHRRRNGESTPRLEESRAVLVTDNGTLAAASREFFRDSRHEWPLVMLDHDLAAMLWVKSPTAAPQLPRRQIIADCLAALQPSQELWQRYVEGIEQLKARGKANDEDLALLRYSGEAARTIMILTQGDAAAVSPAAVEATLEYARDAAAAPARAEANEAKDGLVKAVFEAEALRSEKEKYVARAGALAEQVEGFTDREDLQRERARQRAVKKVNNMRNVALGFLSILIVAAAVLAGLNIGTDLSSGDWRGISLAVLVALGVALGLLRIVFGGSVREWISPTVNRLSARFERRYLRELGLD